LSTKFKLNILWLETKLGIGIDQIQAGKQIPLTNYFFWPKSDTWDQIRDDLETKTWITNKERAEILNLTATIMNEWQNKKSEISEPNLPLKT
jgi:30S ribosomal protein 3